MILMVAVVLFGAPDPMDVHAGDFLDLNPAEAQSSAEETCRLEDWHSAASEQNRAGADRQQTDHMKAPAKMLPAGASED